MRFCPSLTILAVCLVAVGCFEEPVREHVHLTILGGGAAVVTTVQEVAAPWQAGSNPALAERLDGVLKRPRVDLWTSLLALKGRWLSPDLVTAMVSPGPDDRQPEIDPAVFASLPRRFGAPPGAAEVGNALRHQLVPRGVHLIRWRPRLIAPPDFEDTDPRRYLDAGEIPDAPAR